MTGYTVTTYDSGGQIFGTPMTVGAASSSTTVTGLSNGAEYYFGVTANNAAGAGPALFSARWTTPAAPPSAPQNVTGYPSDGQILAMWSAPATNNGANITGYTVVVSGPGGTSAQQSVTGASAEISGLVDGVPYTLSVAATNWAGTSPTASASSQVTPTGRSVSVSGGLQQIPAPVTVANPVSTRWDGFTSGNGRYFFYTTKGDPDLPVFNGIYGIARYDTRTGAKTPVSVDSSGKPLNIAFSGNFYSIVQASYSGSTAVFVGQQTSGSATHGVYVRDLDRQTTVLASPNASGGETAGAIYSPQITGDGSAVFFELSSTADMAQKGCANTGVYRFTVATATLDLITLAPPTTMPADQPIVKSITCIRPNWLDTGSLSISENGRVGAVVVALGTVLTDGETDQTQLNTVVLFDPTSPTAPVSWYTGVTSGFCAIAGVCTLTSGAYHDLRLSASGSELLASGAPSSGWLFADHAVLIPVSNLAAPALDLPLVTALIGPYPGMSADGRIVYGVMPGSLPSQVVAVDVSSGGVALVSQLGGSMGTNDSNIRPGAISDADDTITFTTTAPNLLGLPPNSGGGNVVTEKIADLNWVMPPAQTRGCKCDDSLGSTVALQKAAGEPVNSATGAYTDQADDVNLPGAGVMFDMRRVYDSSNPAVGPLGPGWTMPYAMALSAAANGDVTLTAEDSAQGVFHKAPDGSYRPDPGIRSVLAKTASGWTLTTPELQVDTFDSTGRLVTVVDSVGKGLTLNYTGSQLTSVTDAEQRTVLFHYSSGNGLLASVVLPDGRKVGYAYDASNRLYRVTDLNNQVTSYSYDGTSARLTTVTKPDGTVAVKNSYDPTTLRVLNQQTDNNQSQGALTWDATNQVATYTDSTANHGVSKDYYSGNVIYKHVDADGGATSYTYDAHLNLASVTDPRGDTTTMTYDAAGHMLTRTAPAPLSYQESWVYWPDGKPHKYTDGRGKVTTYDYDQTTGLLSDVVDPMGDETAFTYDAAGRVTTKVTPRGEVAGASAATQALYTTTYAYDPSGNGNLVSVADGLGDSTTYTYWPSGQVHTVTDPRGNVPGATQAMHDAATTTYTYDAAGHVQTVTDPNQHTVTEHYDTNGNKDYSLDGKNQKTQYFYDTDNRLTKTIDPSGVPTTTDYDANGNVADTVDGAGDKTLYKYDSANRLAGVVSARGNVAGATPATQSAYTTQYFYDAAGNRTKIIDPLGNLTTIDFDAVNRPWQVTDPAGRKTVTKYDANSNAIETDAPAGDGTTTAVTTAHFRDDNKVDYVTDARGYLPGADPTAFQTHYGYDADGNKTSQTLPMGEQTQWVYDADERLSQTIDPRGTAGNGALAAQYTTTDHYDPAGHLIQTVNGLGETNGYGYDGAGNQTSTVDPRGYLTGNTLADYTTTYGFDEDNRRTSVLLPKTAAVPTPTPTITAYDLAGNIGSVTDPLGHKTVYGYDGAHHQTSVTTPRGNTTSTPDPNYTTNYHFDPDGNLTTVTDPPTVQVPHPQPTTTSYDALNRARMVTDPLGFQTQTDYNNLGQVDWVRTGIDQTVAGSGYQTAYGYDAAGNQNSVTTPRGTTTAVPDPAYTTRTEFDVDAHRLSQTSPLGEKTTYGYDPDGRLSWTIDPRGNASSVLDPTVFRTQYGYDAAGNQNSVTDPLKHATTTVYDAANRVSSVTDALYRATDYGYWPGGAVRSVTDPAKDGTSYTYDQAGNLSGRTDANQHTTNYVFDAARQLNSVTDPLMRTTQLNDDPDGHLATVTDARGVVSTITTDARSLVTGITYSDGTPAVSFTFDNDHHRTAVADATGSRAAVFDAAGRLKTQTVPAGQAFTYGYDADGNVNFRQYPDGNTATFRFDADEHMASQSADGINTTYSWDAAGHYTGYAAANGAAPATTESLGYDNAGNLAGITDTNAGATTGSWQLTRDAANQPVQAKVAHGGFNGTITYTYDDAGRLNSACPTGAGPTCSSPDGAIPGLTYTYDSVGNLQTQGSSAYNDPASVTVNHYDPADELTSSDTPQGTIRYGYDQAGNQTTVTPPAGFAGQLPAARSYNANDLLASLTLPGGAKIGYTYDADGNQVAASWPGTTPTAPSTTVTQAWDPNGPLAKLATRIDPSGTADYRYTANDWGQQVKTGAGTGTSPDRLLLHDTLGSVTDAFDATGAPAGTGPVDYTPFGTASTDVSTLGSGLLGYNSQLANPDGSYDNRARTYDPITGRFTSQDPIQLHQKQPYTSAYAYAGNQPNTLTDPSGRCPWCIGAAIGGLVGGISYLAGPDDFSWSGFGKSVGTGALIGAGGGLLMPAAGIAAADYFGLEGGAALATRVGVNSLVGAGYSWLTNTVDCKPTTVNDLILGAALGGGGDLLGAGWGKARSFLNPGTRDTGLPNFGDPISTEPVTGDPNGDPGDTDPSCSTKGHSFAADTKVLMADGTSKPIQDVKVGDEVENGDPGGGNEVHRVDAVHRTTTDTDFTDVTIDTGGGAKTVTSTQNHPYYDLTTGTFTDASKLKAGDRLQTDGQSIVTVEAVKNYTASETTYDLTVDGLHTYYVLAGSDPVLVHNVPLVCGPETEKTHYAFVEVRDSAGNVVDDYVVRSGATTPEESGAAIGEGRSRQAVHTEHRIARASGGAAMVGDTVITDDQFWNTNPVPADGTVEIWGIRPPCGTCQAAMDAAAEDTGAQFIYHYSDGSGTDYVWRSKG
jgi:RHS repeat-associated protein